jgi:hypothetical protein
MSRILSLDSGGVRGLSSLLILREITRTVQHITGETPQPLRPCDVFDLIVGTGIGGISAILLGRMRLTIDEAIDDYIRMADAVFQSPSRLSHLLLNHPLFDGKALEDHLRRTVYHRVGHPDKVLFFNPNTPECRTAVLAATSASLDAPPYIFRTYDPHSTFTLIEVARATSATTGLFPPVSLGHPAIKFIDAGVAGYNNPTETALSEAHHILPAQVAKLVLSIGTGTQRIVDAGRNGLGLVELSQQLIDSCESVHDRVCRHLGPKYFRFSVDRGLEDMGSQPWNHTSGLGYLADITSAYLRKAECNRDVTSCAQMITGVTGDLGCTLQVCVLTTILTQCQVVQSKKVSKMTPSCDCCLWIIP